MLWGTVMKIGILGNSVSMIMRPPRENRNDKTYAEILEKDDCYQIIHSGKRGAIISDAYGYLEDEIIRHSPDVVIIHFGIVEAATRIRDRLIYKHSERDDYKNSIFISKYPRTFVDKIQDYSLIIGAKFLELMRRALHRRINWISKQQFEYVLDVYIKQIKKELLCPIIILGVADPGEVLEQKCPGTMEYVHFINGIFANKAKTEDGVYFIDIYSCEEMVGNTPDGSHFNAEGHRVVANKIQTLINRIFNENKIEI